MVLKIGQFEFFPLFKHGDLAIKLLISAIKRIATPFIILGYVNNYEKNRYLYKLCEALYMSHLVRKPTMLIPNRSDTNQHVEAQKMDRG